MHFSYLEREILPLTTYILVCSVCAYVYWVFATYTILTVMLSWRFSRCNNLGIAFYKASRRVIRFFPVVSKAWKEQNALMAFRHGKPITYLPTYRFQYPKKKCDTLPDIEFLDLGTFFPIYHTWNSSSVWCWSFVGNLWFYWCWNWTDWRRVICEHRVNSNPVIMIKIKCESLLHVYNNVILRHTQFMRTFSITKCIAVLIGIHPRSIRAGCWRGNKLYF